jgi:hypothetical protein
MSVTREELVSALQSFNSMLRDGGDLAEAQEAYLSKYVRPGVTMSDLVAASRNPLNIDAIVTKLNKPTTPQTGGKRRTSRKRPKKRSTRRRRRSRR